MTSPSSSSTNRSTPWVAGCCGPMLRTRVSFTAYNGFGFDFGMIWLGTFGVWPLNSTGSSTSG